MPAKAATRLGHQVGCQKPVQEIEDAQIDICLVSPGVSHRPIYVTPIGFRGLRNTIDVSPVNREAGYNLLQCALHNIACEVGGSRVLPCDARRVPGENIEFARHLIEDGADLTGTNGFVEGAMVASKSPIELSKTLLAERIHQ